MNYALYSQAWSARIPSPNTKLVLLCLTQHANAKGVCWPGVQRIMELTGLSRSSVSRSINWLKTNEFIQVTTKKLKNVYRILATKLKAVCVAETHTMCQTDTLNESEGHTEVTNEISSEGLKDLGATPNPEGGGSPETRRQVQAMKLEDIQTNKTWKGLPKAKNKTQLQELWEHWRDGLLERDPNAMVVQATAKQKGQLKNVVARVGAPAAPGLIKGIAANWDDWMYKRDKLVKMDAPNLGFFLANLEDAVAFHQQQLILMSNKKVEADNPAANKKLSGKMPDL